MGLDMDLRRAKREVFESFSRQDYWQVDHYKQEDLVYWRKKYDIDSWFRENTVIIEEYSDEITKDKLRKFMDWLIGEGLKEDADKIQKIIDENDFEEFVIYYTYIN